MAEAVFSHGALLSTEPASWELLVVQVQAESYGAHTTHARRMRMQGCLPRCVSQLALALHLCSAPNCGFFVFISLFAEE